MGDDYLFNLLNAESRIVSGATDALRKIAAAIASAATAPATAVRTLSEFAGTLVDTFNGRLQFLYTPAGRAHAGPDDAGRGVGGDLPVAGQAVRPGAMLTVYVLGPGPRVRAQRLPGRRAASRAAEVAAAQTLVSL